MFGVFNGGASEHAQSTSSSAAPQQSKVLTLFISVRSPSGNHRDRRRTGEAHRGTIADSIGRVFDHAIVRLQARCEFDDRTQIAFDRHWLERYAAVGTHG